MTERNAPDPNDFFRQATIRICGNLNMSTALENSFSYISRFIPADTMAMHYFDPEKNLFHIVAAAGSGKKQALRPPTLIPQRTLDRIITLYGEKWGTSDVIIINEPLRHPEMKIFFPRIWEEDFSILRLSLTLENQRIGGLSIFIKQRSIYNEKHAALLRLLKEPFAIAMSNMLRYRELEEFKERLADENRYLHREMHRMYGDDIIGEESGLKPVMEQIRQVAQTESPVLILGETGVGKEVVANALHYSSARREGPFIKVNCGAIPENLIDSELFGHEKGAFTGASELKKGRFERAHKGTIFLDEVGELPHHAQVRLLRVLQQKEVERVGGTRAIPVDIRIISATNRKLEEMVTGGRFRSDLWFRLNVFPINIPPLRNRKEDIPLLVEHFIRKKTAELKINPNTLRTRMKKLGIPFGRHQME